MFVLEKALYTDLKKCYIFTDFFWFTESRINEKNISYTFEN